MLATAADIAVVLVAALHLWFLVLEMFLWDKPLGRRTFGMTPDKAAATKPLAMNQGLYNGFLAAGCSDMLYGTVKAMCGRASRGSLPGAGSSAS
jgi:putative membrane protein